MSTETVEAEPESVVLSEIEREHYERIIDLNKEVYAASYEHDIAKSKAKSAKEHLESLQAELSNLISEGPKKPDPQQELPFGEFEADAWKRVDLKEVLSLTEKQIEKLDAAGAMTVGEFERLRAGQNPDYPNGLLSVKGFGQATIDKFEEEVLNWLAINAREPEPAVTEGGEE